MGGSGVTTPHEEEEGRERLRTPKIRLIGAARLSGEKAYARCK